MALTLHVLMSPGCENGRKTLELVHDVARVLAPRALVRSTEVNSVADAALLGFRGSPTVLVDGADLEGDRAGGVGLG